MSRSLGWQAMEGALSCLLPVLLLFPLPRSLGSKEDEDTLPQYVPQYALEVCFLGPWILGRALQACRGPEVGVGGHENGPPPCCLGGYVLPLEAGRRAGLSLHLGTPISTVPCGREKWPQSLFGFSCAELDC